jgi:nucleoside-diphosphate-sugar epimerase
LARVLLTGARGFIGRHCRKLLIADGWEVHAVASARDADEAPSGDGTSSTGDDASSAGDDASSAGHEGTVWHAADLLDREQMRRAVARVRPSHLLHLAWYTVPGDLYHSAENQRWVTAGRELLAAVAEHGIRRAVVAGSCAEYDWTGGRCSEAETPLAPATAYGAAKDELRRSFEPWAAESGRSGAWARLFFLYGPGEHPDRLVPYVVRSLLADQPALCTHGEQRRDYLYVVDAAEALVRLLGSEVRGAINIASGTARPLKELIHAVAAQLERPELVRLGARPASPHETPLIEADVQRQTTELRWRPPTSLADGLERTIAWWRQELARGASSGERGDGGDSA